MPRYKKELVPGAYLTAADMLAALAGLRLTAAALEGRVLLAADAALAWLLDSCCVGRAVADTPLPASADAAAHSQEGQAGLGSSGSCSASVLTAVLAAAGGHTAAAETQQRYQAHLDHMALRQQRRRRGRQGPLAAVVAVPVPAAAAAAAPVPAAAAAAAADSEQDGGSQQGRQMQQQEQQEQQVQCWQLVQLSFQEAVFLSHVLSCCAVIDAAAAAAAGAAAASTAQGYQHQQHQQHQQHHLTPAQLWRWCCGHSQGGAAVFAAQYAAYHHFRSLGWLPLPGLMYGGDYVLYQLHPEYSHSEFVVTVMLEQQQEGQQQEGQQQAEGNAHKAAAAAADAMDVDAGAGDTAARGDGGSEASTKWQQQQQRVPVECRAGGVASAQQPQQQQQQLSWLDACIMQRMARQVLKQMLLVYVVMPQGLRLSEPACVQAMRVREVLVRRWLPGEHRDD